jgi:hypothetical protein
MIRRLATIHHRAMIHHRATIRRRATIHRGLNRLNLRGPVNQTTEYTKAQKALTE